MTNTTLTETLQGPDAIRLETRDVHREDFIGATLSIAKDSVGEWTSPWFRFTGKFVVRWSARSARGWGKAYKATFGSEAEARAFAAAKWDVCKGWVAKQPANDQRYGAAEAFSAQVASMRR